MLLRCSLLIFYMCVLNKLWIWLLYCMYVMIVCVVVCFLLNIGICLRRVEVSLFRFACCTRWCVMFDSVVVWCYKYFCWLWCMICLRLLYVISIMWVCWNNVLIVWWLWRSICNSIAIGRRFWNSRWIWWWCCLKICLISGFW